MKKFLVKAFCFLSFITSVNSNYAQCSQDQVGAINYSVTSQFSDMAVAPNGLLYSFAYNSGVGKFYLHSISAPSSSWTPVANINGSTSTKPVIQVSKTGKVYVALKDDAAGQVGKLFYLSGATFIQLGSPFSGANKVSDLSIALNSLGEEYVAYTDITNGNRSTVKKWDGSSWINVGTGTVSINSGYYNSLIIDKTDAPVLAFQDLNSGNKITVMKFNGTSWNFSTSVGSSPTNARLKLGQNGDYYLGYTEDTNNGVVQKFNGSSWSQLGSSIPNLSPTSNAFDLDLDPNDMPYIIALNNTSFYAVAFRYTGSWSNVFGGNISGVTTVNTNVAVDYKGTPYFFYVDQPSNYGLNVKTVTDPTNIVSQPASPTVCNGFLGSIGVGYSGPTPAFQWQVLSAGTFTNILTGGNTAPLNYTATPGFQYYRCVMGTSCKNIISNTSTVTVNTLTVSTTFTNPTCFNSGNGSISASVTGGSGSYTYSWSPVGGTSATATGLYWNTYTLSVTDVMNGCIDTKTITLTSPPSINSSFSGNMNICNGSNTTLTVTATGGVGGFTYNWTPGGSLSSTTSSVVIATPGTTQTYNVSITDASGCVATNTVMVNVNPSPTISANTSTNSICNGSALTLTVTGSGADTYVWNPGNLSGVSQVVSPTSTTVYTVVGTNTLSGCSAFANVTVTVNPLPTVNAGPTRTLTCANTSTTLSGSTTGGITYNWTGPGIVSGGSTLNPTINTAGTYDLSVVSSFGCSAGPSPVTVFSNTTPPSPTASTTGAITCSSPTVSLVGGPASGVTYQWSGPGFSGGTTSQNASATSAGNYTLLVTNSINGCTNTAVTSVTQNTTTPTLSASTSTTSICSGSSATLSATGVGVNTYIWNPGNLSGATRTVSPSSTTVYTVTGTNTITGCSAFANVTVTVNPIPTIIAGPTKSLTCAGTFTILNGSSVGGSSYNWNGPGIVSGYTMANCNVNAVGTYSVFAISAEGCASSTATVAVVLNKNAPTVSASSSGSITCVTSTVALTGGPASGVTYLWSGPGFSGGTTSQNAEANAAGTYTLKVTSTVNSCTNSATTNVVQNTVPPNPFANSSGTITCSSPTVALNALPASGVTYLWSGTGITGSTTTQTTSVNAGGNYTLSITSLTNGCSNTFPLMVVQNTTQPLPTATNSTTLTCSTTTAVLTGGPASGVSYLWSGSGLVSGINSQNAEINAAGVYSLTVTDITNGCVSTTTVDVSEDVTPPFMNISASPSTICSGNSSNILIGGADTYTWSTGENTNSISVSPITTTIYTVSGTGTNGCISSTSQTITVNSSPSLSITGSGNICKGSTSTLTVNGATSYTWNSGANTTTISITPTITTTYTVNGDNGNGCSASLTTTVTIIPNKTITGIITSTAGTTNGDVILYRYTPELSHWDSITTVPFTSTYSFTDIDSAQYVLRAIPTATNIQVTYGASSISWQNATIITHGCSNNSTQNINLIAFENFTEGPGILSGKIIEGDGFGQTMRNEFKPLAPGEPIGGIVVKGGRNPGGQMFTQTITDAAGQYTLTGFPVNTGTEEYFVFVDIPGLDTNGTYHRVISTENFQYENLNFIVDSMYIHPVGVASAINSENSILNNSIILYPNPATNQISIKYELISTATIKIELFDILGQKVKDICVSNLQEKNKYTYSTNIEDLNRGIYFIKFKVNNNETSLKLILTD